MRISGTKAVPVHLHDTDVAILKSLMQDGRKSFRAISREIKVSTPTVKARYERLVNMGLIKAVKPQIDTSKIAVSKRGMFKSPGRMQSVMLNDLKVKMKCEFCGGPIYGAPKVLRFANLERFFCCVSCRSGYREKYAGRIQSLVEQYKEKKK